MSGKSNRSLYQVDQLSTTQGLHSQSHLSAAHEDISPGEDPSLTQGHTVALERDIYIQICSEDNSQAPKAWQTVRLRLLTLGDEGDLINIRAEIDSEEDLFFHYTFALDKEEFPHFQLTQKLRVVYQDFPHVLSKMVNDSLRDPNVILAVLVISEDGSTARLDYIQNNEYKLVELLSLPLKRTDPQRVRDSLTYRYRSMKAKTASMAKRLDEIHTMLKIKSPSLLLRLNPEKTDRPAAKRDSPSKKIPF